MTCPALVGKRLLLTRPQGQNEALAALLAQAGAMPLVFPMLAIYEAKDLSPLQQLPARLSDYDWALFISANAVEKALNILLADGQGWPATVKVAAIGRATAKALAHFGIREVRVPLGRFDSESLLENPELHSVADKKILIFRGDGGRELLGDTLKNRGAVVEYIEAYRRGLPENSDISLLMRAWGREGVDLVVVSSGEILANLYDQLGKLGQMWLKKTPLLVFSERLKAQALARGCKKVLVSEEASDQGVLKSCCDYFTAAEKNLTEKE
jgi:uroporphyrinogen-III synthase